MPEMQGGSFLPTKPPDHNPSPTPERAVYGFVFHLLATTAFIVYLAWLILPDEILQSLGLEFLPQKYWAVAVPIYVTVVFLVSVFIIYPSLGMWMTPSLADRDMRYVVDRHTVYNHDSALYQGGIRPEAATNQVPLVCDMLPQAVLAARARN